MAVSLSIITAGTIGDYGDLVEKVASWLDRDDLEGQIPDFIALLEARINRLVRSINSEIQAIWVTAEEFYMLPTDFRKLRRIHIEGTPDRPLVEMSPVAVPGEFNGSTGTPRAYFIQGRTIGFAPPPAADTTFRVSYFRRIPPLSAAEPYNWLLQEHPDIYLWGVLHQAATYVRDPDAIDTCKGYLDEAISELQRESRLDRWGGGPLVPGSVRQVSGARC